LGARKPCRGTQASSLSRRVASLAPPPQLLVASPLRRALRTAELAFGAHSALPRLVSPLCRERLYHSSDVGRAPAVVGAEFPAWCAAAPPCALYLTPGSSLFCLGAAFVHSFIQERL
jgi:broad specificity phosphatase PhoE